MQSSRLKEGRVVQCNAPTPFIERQVMRLARGAEAITAGDGMAGLKPHIGSGRHEPMVRR